MGRLVDTLRAVGALDNTLVSRVLLAHRFAISSAISIAIYSWMGC